MDKVVHFEIPADNIDRAQKFYQEIFGWDIQKAPNMPYWILKTAETDDKNMIKEPGAINGGMMMRDEKNDPGSTNPSIVINVSDINNYIEKIKKAGGELVTGPTEIPNMGKYARVKDTENNIIGIWQDQK